MTIAHLKMLNKKLEEKLKISEEIRILKETRERYRDESAKRALSEVDDDTISWISNENAEKIYEMFVKALEEEENKRAKEIDEA